MARDEDTERRRELYAAQVTERRRELCAELVTLNGRPATVGGIRSDHATVTALDNGEHYEWAWPTVARIVERGGRFVS